MKKIIYMVIFIALILFGTTFYMLTKNDVKAQLIQFDIMEDTEKVVKKFNVKLNTIINLEQFDGNNIKILEITDEYVKISREAIKYEILSRNENGSGEFRKYTETILENIKYDALIDIDINEQEPFGPSYVQPRYYYNIKFVK